MSDKVWPAHREPCLDRATSGIGSAKVDGVDYKAFPMAGMKKITFCLQFDKNPKADPLAKPSRVILEAGPSETYSGDWEQLDVITELPDSFVRLKAEGPIEWVRVRIEGKLTQSFVTAWPKCHEI